MSSERKLEEKRKHEVMHVIVYEKAHCTLSVGMIDTEDDPGNLYKIKTMKIINCRQFYGSNFVKIMNYGLKTILVVENKYASQHTMLISINLQIVEKGCHKQELQG